MFWMLAAGVTVICAYAILSPVWRAGATAQPAAAYDLRVYRDQLREVDRDLERGVIRADDAERLRAEIGRKVLDTDRRLSQTLPATSQGRALWPALAVVMMLAGAVGLYLREGVPGAPDMPLGERLAAADAAYHDRPSQAEAEAAAPARTPAAPADADPDYLAMIEQLRSAVARNPEDPQGLALLATHEMRLGNLVAAREAQERLVALQGAEAAPTALLQLATLMVETAGGLITPQAEALLGRALAVDPTLPQARYLQGVLLIQNGRPDRAFPVWRDLLEDGPETAPWIASIRAALPELAWLAGEPDYVLPPAPDAALPGPDADALAAAQDLSPEARDEMIQSMISGLQQRLATEGGSPQEWARLIAALGVVGQTEQAEAILTEARERFGATPEAMAPIEAAAAQAGLAR